jgi:aminoglycoside phosphotransferase (APT) family kinase protein
VAALYLLAGGASQEAWAVEIVFDDVDALSLVMRRDMGGVLNFATLSRATEFAVIGAAYASGVPAPRPYFEPCEIDGKPAFFMERVPGEAVGRRLVTDPAFAEARKRLPEQLAEALAAIHRVDYRAAGLDALVERPAPGRSAVSVAIERTYRELDSVNEAHPALELALRWLVRHEPEREAALTLVHGDFRIGNVLVDEHGLRAVLDWEFSHIGDPDEDVTWPLVRAWRFGQTALEAGGITSRETWLQAYEKASGRRVDRRRIAYLEILGNVKWAVGALMQARRHLSGLEPSIELASLGRLSAEMEFEALRGISAFEATASVR